MTDEFTYLSSINNHIKDWYVLTYVFTFFMILCGVLALSAFIFSAPIDFTVGFLGLIGFHYIARDCEAEYEFWVGIKRRVV